MKYYHDYIQSSSFFQVHITDRKEDKHETVHHLTIYKRYLTVFAFFNVDCIIFCESIL